jgi:hypothetical protein
LLPSGGKFPKERQPKMKKVLVALACLPLMVISSGAKSKRDTVLVPHATSDQVLQAPEQDRERGFARQVGRAFDISASMVARDDHTLGLLLKITNASSKRLVFAPDEIVVILPNGHSYRPFTQTDVLQEAYAVEADPKGAKPNRERIEVSQTISGAGCSVDGDSASCPTTADLATEQWHARRVALRAMTRSATHDRKLKNYVRGVREQYLGSRELAPGAAVSGYVDVYVEDIRSGPFTVRLPAGDTRWVAPAPGKLAVPVRTYDLSFGPEVMDVPR